jgi:hypothetical protein
MEFNKKIYQYNIIRQLNKLELPVPVYNACNHWEIVDKMTPTYWNKEKSLTNLRNQ